MGIYIFNIIYLLNAHPAGAAQSNAMQLIANPGFGALGGSNDNSSLYPKACIPGQPDRSLAAGIGSRLPVLVGEDWVWSFICRLQLPLARFTDRPVQGRTECRGLFLAWSKGMATQKPFHGPESAEISGGGRHLRQQEASMIELSCVKRQTSVKALGVMCRTSRSFFL